MNKCIVNAKTNELIAYISDEHENILKNGYEVIDYGNNEPVFTERDGVIYVKENSFEVKLD